MEFSEAYELNDLLKISPAVHSRLHTYHNKTTTSLLETMMNSGLEIEDSHSFSPKEFFVNDISYQREFSTTEAIEPVKVEVKPQDTGPVVLQVTRDDNFKESYAQSLCKTSSLAESLKTDILVKPAMGISLVIYLFGSQEKLKLSIPKKITVEQLNSRIIATYSRDERFKNKPLPCGPIAEAYEIVIADSASGAADPEIIDKSTKVKDLDTNTLGFLVKSSYSEMMKSPVTIINEANNKGKIIKVYYEKNCTLVQISEQSTVKNLLEKLSVHYGYLNPSEYDFKVILQVEELIQQECDISMDLKISSLTTDELKLYRKVYADSPSLIEKHEKYVPVKAEEDQVKYDSSRFNMTRAQASAYKEYEVIKTNKRGKRQKRILGINQLRLYNMTVDQAKAKLKQKALDQSEKGVFKRIESWYKAKTYHPEIPISSVHGVEQDSTNLCIFYIDYTEKNTRKKRLYEVEKSAIAVEVISKLNKLISMNKSEGNPTKAY